MVDGYIQEYWQIRSGDTVGIDVDSGWAANENTTATIGTGVVFRIRFKVRRIGVGVAHQFKLQVRHESGSWQDVDIKSGITTTSAAVICLPSSQYSDGATISSELLTSDGGATWEDGDGVAAVEETGNILTVSHDLDDEETEFEYCLMINSFFYHPQNSFDQVQENDTLEFRMVQSDSTAFPNTYSYATVTVSETQGFIGGTSIERPQRIIHTNGDDIYVLCEDNGRGGGNPDRLVVKSTDRGATWRAQDDANKPSQQDWESGDSVVSGSTIYIGSQLTNDAYHDTFEMSTDAWGTTDEAIRTGVTRDDQVAAIVRRSDGDLIAFWQEQNTDFRIRYAIDSGAGWGSPADVDSTASTLFAYACAVVDDADMTHIFYVDNTNGNLYHKALTSGDVLDSDGNRDLVHDDIGTTSQDEGALIGAVFYLSGATKRIVVAFRDGSDGLIYTSKIDDNGTPSTPVAATDASCFRDGIGDNAATADLAVIGTDLYIVYADNSTQDIWITHSDDYGSWDTDIEVIDDIECDVVVCHAYELADSSKQVGIFYEDGSNGTNGFARYYEHEIAAASGLLINVTPSDSNYYTQGVRVK
jgi:hypothetical protein